MAKKASSVKAPAKQTPQPKSYTSQEISLECLDRRFKRADLVFYGVDHAGVSYEARIFLNNNTADSSTPKQADKGYAGSYHIFGHGGCFGDVGHCDIRGVPRPYDPRPSHPLTPAKKVVIATEAIRQAQNSGPKVTVTIVPVILSGTERCDYQDVVKLDRVSIVTYV